jgi:predicted kinase
MKEKPEREIKLLVAMPGVGKSTYAREYAKELKGYNVLSIDDITRERYLKRNAESDRHFSMDRIRMDENHEIVEEFYRRVRKAVDNGENIIIDRCGKTVGERARSLDIAKYSDKFNYKTTAIVLSPPPEEEHIRRLWRRSIMEDRFDAMNGVGIAKIEPIKAGEFDRVIQVGSPPEKPLYWQYRLDSEFPSLLRSSGNGEWQR